MRCYFLIESYQCSNFFMSHIFIINQPHTLATRQIKDLTRTCLSQCVIMWWYWNYFQLYKIISNVKIEGGDVCIWDCLRMETWEYEDNTPWPSQLVFVSYFILSKWSQVVHPRDLPSSVCMKVPWFMYSICNCNACTMHLTTGIQLWLEEIFHNVDNTTQPSSRSCANISQKYAPMQWHKVRETGSWVPSAYHIPYSGGMSLEDGC